MIVTVSSQEQFNQAVNSSATPVVVLFTAPSWCVPCQRFKPHYESAAENAADEFTFLSVDIDDNDWAVQTHSIQSVPTVVLLDSTGTEDRRVKVPQNAVPFLNDIRS